MRGELGRREEAQVGSDQPLWGRGTDSLEWKPLSQPSKRSRGIWQVQTDKEQHAELWEHHG